MPYFTDIEETIKENNVWISETEFDSVDWICMNGQTGKSSNFSTVYNVHVHDIFYKKMMNRTRTKSFL